MTDQIPNPFLDKPKINDALPQGRWYSLDEAKAKYGEDTLDLRQRPDGVWELPK